VCCSPECLGGCANALCNACAEGKLLQTNGSCADSCGSTFEYGFKVRNVASCGWARHDARRYCVETCPDGTFVQNKECVAHCDGMATPNAEGICPLGHVGRVCDLHFDVDEDDDYYSYDDDYVDDSVIYNGFGSSLVKVACHVEVMDGLECDILHGGILLDQTGVNENRVTQTSMGVFNKLTRITGAVYMFQTPFVSLSFLSNVESIGECDEDTETPWPTCNGVVWHDNKYALKISENSLMTSLSLTSLRTIGGPGGPESPVYIKDNFALCLVDTIEWSDISVATEPTGPTNGNCNHRNHLSIPCQLGFTTEFLTSSRIELSMDSVNETVQLAFATEPVNPLSCGQAEKQCASECGGRGCWDFSAAGCQRCPDAAPVLHDGVCTEVCSAGFFESVDRICVACDSTCAACTASKECTVCAVGHRLLGSTCEETDVPVTEAPTTTPVEGATDAPTDVPVTEAPTTTPVLPQIRPATLQSSGGGGTSKTTNTMLYVGVGGGVVALGVVGAILWKSAGASAIMGVEFERLLF
jgi:hypothetical protein